MSVEKAKINGQLVDVISIDDYHKNPEAYDKFNAIKLNDGYIYPIRNKTDDRPGAYRTDFGVVFKQPEAGQSDDYSDKNLINFSDVSSLKDYIAAQNKYRAAEWSVLTSADNIFMPEPNVGDAPEMRALKTAIKDKGIDLDKYESRFGQNYNNDKRLLRKDTITLSKLKSITSILDMKASLILEDSGPDVPNPIGHQIIVELNPKDEVNGDEDDESSEAN